MAVLLRNNFLFVNPIPAISATAVCVYVMALCFTNDHDGPTEFPRITPRLFPRPPKDDLDELVAAGLMAVDTSGRIWLMPFEAVQFT